MAALALFSISCSSTKPYALGPVKTFDPDTSRIPQPEENASYQYWDRIDNTVFHQIEKPLDLNKTFRFAGRLIGVSDAKEAVNVNRLDEVPESSWYQYRHYHDTMSTNQLKQGPNSVEPDTSGNWTIFSAKLEGANPGFFIEDAKGNRFLIKFDGPEYPELTTSAEVISTKLFYAAGYNVPEATIAYFDPEKVSIGEDVMVMDKGEERPMNMKDYRSIIEGKTRNAQGKIRALASKFVDGIPVGQWTFEGTRSDDPNDKVKHEDRREVRGMRIISSWLNDTDRRDANTMAVYTDEGYIKHYVQDFGNTLGANGASIHGPIYGQAYLIDPRYMARNAITLGTYINSWETIDAQNHIPHPSVGYFRADVFKPGQWVSAHPLPAYENMTLRDAFWGAKLVSGFSNEEIRAIVETGKLSNESAEEYLVDVLVKRRDKLARYWFSRINPIDKFSARDYRDRLELTFADLGLQNEVFTKEETIYKYTIFEVSGGREIKTDTSSEPRLSLRRNRLPESNGDGKPIVLEYEISTKRKNADVTEKPTKVYIALESAGPRVVGIQRD